MAVLIGHSSIDENGKISGGVAGDQTGKEVCIRDFYVPEKGIVILRPKKYAVAECIARCTEDICKNDNVGYDQNQRLSLYDAVKNSRFRCDSESLKTKVECDCSSLVRVAVSYAGITVGNFTTENEKPVLLATDEFTEIAYTNGMALKRGDIAVTKTKGHTFVILSDGTASGSNGNTGSSSGSNANTVKAGTKHYLNNAPVYTSEYGKTVGNRTGTYYTWDNVVKNGRIRMTNRLDRVGKAGQVSFFVDVSNL